VKCDTVAPKCSECVSLGLVCEYGRPVWWYDEDLKQEQKEINKRLIKEHKAMLALRRKSLERTRQADSSNPGITPRMGLKPVS
jgi:Na+-translocating ferredoxin:NAD+ oxidoreductase RnfC subunit